MKSLILLLLVALMPRSSVAEQPEVKFGGKYLMKVYAPVDSYEVEFLMRSSGEITVLRADLKQGRGLNSQEASQVEMRADFNQPFAYDVEPTYLTIRSVAGSDEQAVTGSVTLVIDQVFGGENLGVVAVGAFSIYEDGPNGHTEPDDDGVKIFKWNTVTDEYQEI